MLNLGLTGKKAIVCASSRGLGRACARALALAGADVVINGRDETNVIATAKALSEETGANITPVPADVAILQGQNALLEACPNPDILVNNNAGPPARNFRDVTRQALLDGIEANMAVPLAMIQRVIDGMIERRYGRIVNITSLSVKMPMDGLDLSSGARAGLTSFLAGVAREIAPHNVTINFLLPGLFATDRLRALNQAHADRDGISLNACEEKKRAMIPASRFGDPDEFGHACALLCSIGYITGQNLVLDGGLFPSTF